MYHITRIIWYVVSFRQFRTDRPYQVLDSSGSEPTFAQAIASAVSYLTGYLAGDRLDALKEKHNNPLDHLN